MVIVVVSPIFQFNTRLMQRGEGCGVKMFISELAVEAFYKTVLLWLSRRNVMPLYMHFISPVQNGVAGELGAIVRNNHLG
jgi:hypothetical protein